jgi:hypothetical protein
MGSGLVSQSKRIEGRLHWYPRKWREKYGAGMVALLEDTYGDTRLPMAVRFSLMRRGTHERIREGGFIGAATAWERRRSAWQWILAGWTAFMLAGAIVAKFTDNWVTLSSALDRTSAHLGYGLVQWSGTVGMLVVVAAALIVLPSLARLVRDGGWDQVGRPVLRALVVVALAIVATGGIVFWANHLSFHQRNGGLAIYQVIVTGWSLLLGVSLVVASASAISVSRRVELSLRQARWLSAMLAVLTALMVAIVVGLVIWWRVEALHAPTFMRNAIGNGIMATSSTFPPALVLAFVLMIVGLAMAMTGVTRLVGLARTSSRA